MVGIFDTHCHLMSPEYKKERLEDLIKDATISGVTRMCEVGYSLKSSLMAVNHAIQYSNIYAAVGIHPTEVVLCSSEDLKSLEELAANEEVVAIGEIGLDYFHKVTSHELQKTWFINQLHLAKKLDLPVSIHCRDAYDDCYEILKKEVINKGIMHCFLGTAEQAKKFIDLGFMISFSGVITFKNAKLLIPVVESIPIGKILVETDAPYLAPEPYRGKLNYVQFINYTVKKIAEIKKLDLSEVIRITNKNAEKVFNIKN